MGKSCAASVKAVYSAWTLYFLLKDNTVVYRFDEHEIMWVKAYIRSLQLLYKMDSCGYYLVSFEHTVIDNSSSYCFTISYLEPILARVVCFSRGCKSRNFTEPYPPCHFLTVWLRTFKTFSPLSASWATLNAIYTPRLKSGNNSRPHAQSYLASQRRLSTTNAKELCFPQNWSLQKRLQYTEYYSVLRTPYNYT
jgi:hypothetical protein